MDNEFISLEDFLSYNEEIKATSATPLTLKFIQPEDTDINERRKKHIAPIEDEFEGISANSSSSISIKNAKLIVSTLFAMFAQRHVERQINLVLRTNRKK
jgi:hypothetical protein